MPAPAEQHRWLDKFVGEWQTTTEIYMEPGKPPIKGTGGESVRSLGGFWIISEGKGEMMGMSMNFLLTLGYDEPTKKYVGSWVDSMTGHLWKYEGAVDAAGKTITLQSTGPCPKRPGELSNFKDITEFKDNDTRTFTSMMQDTDGQWVKVASGTATRVKK